MPNVFISYSRADKPFAGWLAAELERMGVDVWIDVEDIEVGQKWSTAIQQALDATLVMIVVISPHSAASKNVEDEWQYFLDQNRPLIPVLREPAKIHFQLSRIQYIDFCKQPPEMALAQLCVELERKGVHFTVPIPKVARPKAEIPRFVPVGGPPAVPAPTQFPKLKPARSAHTPVKLIRALFKLIGLILISPLLLLRGTARTLRAGRQVLPSFLKVVLILAVIASVLVLKPWAYVDDVWNLVVGKYENKNEPMSVTKDFFTAFDDEDMDQLRKLVCRPSKSWEESKSEEWRNGDLDFSDLSFTRVNEQTATRAWILVEGTFTHHIEHETIRDSFSVEIGLFKRNGKWCVEDE